MTPGGGHRGRSKPTPRPQRRRQLGTEPANKRVKGYALSLPPLHRRCEWPERDGRRQINNPVASPPRPALKDRECQPRTAKVGRQATQDQPSSEQDVQSSE